MDSGFKKDIYFLALSQLNLVPQQWQLIYLLNHNCWVLILFSTNRRKESWRVPDSVSWDKRNQDGFGTSCFAKKTRMPLRRPETELKGKAICFKESPTVKRASGTTHFIVNVVRPS